jgi:protein TonB
VQVSATPPGGMNAFRKQISSSFRLPEVDETTTGTVIAKFVVWDDGSIRDIQIVKESPAGLGLAKEATRILTKSPKWTPGVYNGRSVKQYYTLPISIQITASE